jgi:hypothetical protein
MVEELKNYIESEVDRWEKLYRKDKVDLPQYTATIVALVRLAKKFNIETKFDLPK